MAALLSIPSSSAAAATFPSISKPHRVVPQLSRNRVAVRIRCETEESSNAAAASPENNITISSSPEAGRKAKLQVGSPVVIVEAPRMVKTAASVPCLRVNSGLVNPGDVGRIVSRKPKDLWAVRLAVGTYLIDGKYFKPLELDE